jgi:hypothetical protein
MKKEHLVKKVSAELDVLRFPSADQHRIEAHCLKCSSPLSLFQPDLSTPERLLGVCERCKHWFLVDLIPDLTEGVLSRLPDIEVIRQLSLENPPAGTSKMSNDRDA